MFFKRLDDKIRFCFCLSQLKLTFHQQYTSPAFHFVLSYNKSVNYKDKTNFESWSVLRARGPWSVVQLLWGQFVIAVITIIINIIVMVIIFINITITMINITITTRWGKNSMQTRSAAGSSARFNLVSDKYLDPIFPIFLPTGAHFVLRLVTFSYHNVYRPTIVVQPYKIFVEITIITRCILQGLEFLSTWWVHLILMEFVKFLAQSWQSWPDVFYNYDD